MKILALETSCEIASIALCDGPTRLSVSLTSPPNHSATLLPAVRKLLTEAGVTLRELDVIAFGCGPGAFTGVRLACSVAQGLAVGADLPVAPVSCLDALAWPVAGEKIYCAIDARMSEAYVACYLREAQGLRQVAEPVCVPPAALPIPDGEGWVGVGTAFRAYAEASLVRLGTRVQVVSPAAVPTALAVADLARTVSWIDPALAAPVYVRDRVALTVAERLAAGGRA